MRAIIMLAAFLLDALLGDPQGLWHPVCAIGKLIALGEKRLRGWFPTSPRGETIAGGVLWLFVCAVSFAVPFALLWLAARVHPLANIALETLMCYQIFARKSLRTESMKVHDRLTQGDLAGARVAVSYIVGRDTAALDTAGVTRAAVETVAENTTDGVIAPMLFMALGGAPLAFLYKAVNTMDSMLGYKNEKYRHFGCVAAKMDDAFSYIPARISALCMILAAHVLRFDGANAYRIWKRDRRKHASPNAAQTESVCAGALGVALAGDAYYFGTRYEKPTIGDATRDICPQDIAHANTLMLGASCIALVLCVGARIAVGIW